MNPVLVETIGYIASGLIVLSLAMTSVVKLRIVSLIGAATFTVYGLLIGSLPVAVSNAIIVCLNLWNLYKLTRTRSDLDAVPMDTASPFLADFLASHKADIHRSQPEFETEASDTAFVLMRDGMPAGAVVGRLAGDQLQLTLDYVLPAYRDLRLGKWLYGEGAGTLRRNGVRQIVSHPTTEVHRSYLQGVGFTESGGQWVRTLG